MEMLTAEVAFTFAEFVTVFSVFAWIQQFMEEVYLDAISNALFGAGESHEVRVLSPWFVINAKDGRSQVTQIDRLNDRPGILCL